MDHEFRHPRASMTVGGLCVVAVRRVASFLTKEVIIFFVLTLANFYSQMRVIPFPLTLNVGTDIVHIPRILRLVTRSSANRTNTYLDRFVRRILSEEEQAHFLSKFPQHLSGAHQTSVVLPILSKAPPNVVDMARWLAGRFAAKEAARKAAPGGAASISWKEVIVRVEPEGNGRPEVVYLKKGESTGYVGKLSISHDGEYVVATVIAADAEG